MRARDGRACRLVPTTLLDRARRGGARVTDPCDDGGCDASAVFRDAGPELLKTAEVRVVDDGPLKPSSIHQHVGQRPILAAGNTDGDLAMLQWAAGSPHLNLELVIRHTDGDREYAYDRDPILGSGTEKLLAAAAEHEWTVSRHGRRLGRRPRGRTGIAAVTAGPGPQLA